MNFLCTYSVEYRSKKINKQLHSLFICISHSVPAFFPQKSDFFCCLNTITNISCILPLACEWASVFTLCVLWLTERASCWRLKLTLAQITCLKDALEPIHFGENLVQDQCWHTDELCSGVARGTMIMARACRIISGALMAQEELMKYTPNHTRSRHTQAHHW